MRNIRLHQLSINFFISVCLLFLYVAPIHAKIVYVDANNILGGDGANWDQAFNKIQGALDNADPNDQVWVAKGIYYENIQLISRVSLYGGFIKGAESLEDRNFDAHVTYIDGNIGGVRTGPVVTGANDALIDGFTIRNGLADFGAGIYCNNTSPFVTHCIIKDNQARIDGGGIYCFKANPKIIDNSISENTAGLSFIFYQGWGGGMMIKESSPILKKNHITNNFSNCGGGGISIVGVGSLPMVIEENDISYNNTGVDSNTGYGGGVYDGYGDNTICLKNNVIKGNHANSGGGGILGEYCSIIIEKNIIEGNTAYYSNQGNTGVGGGLMFRENSSPIIRNNLISNNQTNYKGGGIHYFNCRPFYPVRNNNNLIIKNKSPYGGGISIENSYMEIINCTLFGNDALESEDSGDGLYCITTSTVTIRNSILWNMDTDIYCEAGSTVKVSYSDIRVGNWGIEGNIHKNINTEPKFINPQQGIFHLAAGSPCLDKGDPALPDPYGITADMGAYGGPWAETDWTPIIYGRGTYWMSINVIRDLRLKRHYKRVLKKIGNKLIKTVA